MGDRAGNLPPLPSVYLDSMAPIVRNSIDGDRELDMARCGMPGSFRYDGAPITNIRNTKRPHWRRLISPTSRCLVPVTSFCVREDTRRRKTPTWFALDVSQPLFAFAGIWTTSTGTRGTIVNPTFGGPWLYAFLTTEPNRIVGRIHSDAMPVMLTTAEERDEWLRAPWSEAAAP